MPIQWGSLQLSISVFLGAEAFDACPLSFVAVDLFEDQVIVIGLELADAGGADRAVIGRVHGFLRFGLIADHATETAVCEDIGLQNAGFFSLRFFFQTEAGFFFLPRQVFGTDVLVDLGRVALGTFHLAIG